MSTLPMNRSSAGLPFEHPDPAHRPPTEEERLALDGEQPRSPVQEGLASDGLG